MAVSISVLKDRALGSQMRVRQRFTRKGVCCEILDLGKNEREVRQERDVNDGQDESVQQWMVEEKRKKGRESGANGIR